MQGSLGAYAKRKRIPYLDFNFQRAALSGKVKNPHGAEIAPSHLNLSEAQSVFQAKGEVRPIEQQPTVKEEIGKPDWSKQEPRYNRNVFSGAVFLCFALLIHHYEQTALLDWWNTAKLSIIQVPDSETQTMPWPSSIVIAFGVSALLSAVYFLKSTINLSKVIVRAIISKIAS